MARPRAGDRPRWLHRFRSGRLLYASATAACWALLLQLLIPLFHTPPAQAANDPARVWAAPICHADSPAASDLGADGHPEPAKQLPGAHPVCPICFGLHLAGTYTPPNLSVLPVPLIVEGVRFEAAAQTPPPRTLSARARARAPPPAA